MAGESGVSNGADLGSEGSVRSVYTGDGDITLVPYSLVLQGSASYQTDYYTTGQISIAPSTGQDWWSGNGVVSFSGTMNSTWFEGSNEFDGLHINNFANISGLNIGTVTSTGTAGDTAYVTANTQDIDIDTAISIAGTIRVHANDITVNNSITSTVAGDITLSATNNFSSGTTTRYHITNNNGAINVYADADADGTGSLNIDYLTFDAGINTLTLRSETVSWSTGSSLEKPYINGTGDFVVESSDASFGQSMHTTWFNIDQDNDGIGSIRIGRPTNDQDVAINTDQTFSGSLTVYGDTIAINANLTSTATSGTGISLNAKQISQGDGTTGNTVSTSGADIVYNATNYIATTGLDYVIHLDGGTSGDAVIDANGGDITLAANFASSGGSANTADYHDAAIYTEYANFITDGSGTISITGDGTNNPTTRTSQAWGIHFIYDSLLQTEHGDITITGTGGNQVPNSRGVIIDRKNFKALSYDGTITVTDKLPSNTSGSFTYGGMYIMPTSTSNTIFGSDGTTALSGSDTSSSANVVLRADKLTLGANGAYKTQVNTSGNVVIEPSADDFYSGISLANLILDGIPANVRIGKETTGADGTNDASISFAGGTIAGDISIYANEIALSSAITNTATSESTLLFKASDTITIQGDITANNDKLNVILWSDADGNGDGRVSLSNNITTNGGGVWVGGSYSSHGDGTSWIPYAGAAAITVGDGFAATENSTNSAIYAPSGTISTSGGNITFYGYGNDDSGNENNGINLAGLNLSSGAGNIDLNGIANSAETTGTYAFGTYIHRGSDIQSTTGNITISGTLGSASDFVKGAGTWIGSNADTTTATGDVSINTTTGTISISGTGQSTGTGNNWRYGTVLFPAVSDDLTISSTSGHINISGEGNFHSVTYTGGLSLQTENTNTLLAITSQTGNINLTGSSTQESSIANQHALRLWSNNAANNLRIGYNGSNAYSGNITLKANSIHTAASNSGTGSLAFVTSGNVFIRPEDGDSNFSEALDITDDWTFGTDANSITIGTATNTADITVATDIVTQTAFSLHGTNLTISADINTSAGNGDISLSAINQFLSADSGSISITAGTGNVSLVAERPYLDGSTTLNSANNTIITTTGHFTLAPYEVVSNGFQNVGNQIEFQGAIASGNFAGSGDIYGLDINNIANLTGLTIGKAGSYHASTMTGYMVHIDAGTTLNINGPINIYGKDIYLNNGIATTNATTGDISITGTTLKGSGGISLATGRNLTVNQSSTSTYSGVISGTSATVTKAGVGALTLSGSNTFTGTVTINTGTLATNNDAGLGTNASGVIVKNGTTLDLQGVTIGGEAITLNGGTLKASTGTSSLTGNITLGANSTIDVSGSGLTLSGVISGAYDVSKSGAGELIFSNDNTYTGSTTINAGTLQIGNGGSTGSLATSAITNNGTLKYHLGKDHTVSYAISGSGDLEITGTQVDLFSSFLTTSPQTLATNTTVLEMLERLSGARLNGARVPGENEAGIYHKQYDATTDTATFQVQFFNDSSSDYVKVVFVKLQQNGNNVDVLAYAGRDGHTTLYKQTTVADLGNDYTTAVYSGSLGLATDTTTLSGYGLDRLYTNGKIRFTADNTYTGTTTLINTVAQVTSGSNQYLKTAQAYVELGNNGTSGSLGSGSIINAGVIRVNRSDNLTLANDLSGTGSLIKAGANTLTLTGNATHTGNTYINGGSLVVEDDTPALASNFHGPGSLTIQSASNSFTSTFNTSAINYSDIGGLTIGKVSNTTDITFGSNTTIAGDITIYGPSTLGGNTTFNTSSANGDITFNGTIDGPYDLSINSGSGNIALNNELGGTTKLADLTITSSANLTLNNDITTFGQQTYNAPVVLGANINLNSTGIAAIAATTYSTANSYQDVTFAEGGEITFELHGARGGYGGSDITSGGSPAYGDSYTITVDLDAGTNVRLAVGSNGYNGNNGVLHSTSSGGSGGSNTFAGFDGGSGGSAYSSGGGGGGGAATVVEISIGSGVYLVAGGGGGAGGAGYHAVGGSGSHATGSMSTTSGQSASYRSSDGGAGGGGGGGISGGSAGGYNGGGDMNGYGGRTGTSGIVDTANTLTYSNATTAASGFSSGRIVYSRAASPGGVTFNNKVDGAHNLTVSASESGSVTFTQNVGATTNLANITATTNGSGATVFNGASSITTTTNQTYSGATTINDNITFNAAALSFADMALAANKTATLDNTNASTVSGVISGAGHLSKTGSGDISITANATHTGDTNITTGNLIFENDAPTSGGTTIKGAGQAIIRSSGNAFTSTFNTNGWNFDNTLGGLTIGKSTNTSDVSVDDISLAGSLSVFAGNITVAGNLSMTVSSAVTLLKASGDITLAANKSITTNGGDVILWSNSDGSGDNGYQLLRDGSSITTGGGHLWMGGGSGTSTWNGLTVGNGYATAGAVISSSTFIGSSDGGVQSAIYLENASINTAGGHVAMYGEGDDSGERGILSIGDFTLNAGAGKILLDAKSNNEISFIFGHHSVNTSSEAVSLTTTNTAADAISINTTSANIGTGWSYGTWIEGTANLLATNGGGISLTTAGAANGINLGYSNSAGTLNMFSSSGDITLNTGSNGINIRTAGSSINLGRGGSTVTTSSSDLIIIADDFSSNGLLGFNTSGSLTIKPQASNSFASTFDTSNLTYSSDVSGLTIGHSNNTGDITIGSSTAIAGDVTLYGGNIAVDSALTLTNSGTLAITASGTITDGTSGAIVAPKLAINGATSVTLDHANTDFDTIAASSVGNLSLIDKDTLTIGSVNPTGINSTGTVSITTLTGNLTLSENITTTDTSSSAIVLNAGKNTAAGTSTGGNVIISGTPTLTTGTGGRATLYTGSVSGSTGLTAFIGSGSGDFRYNSDEASTGFSTSNAALSSGIYAIYRERPSVTYTASNTTITYGDTLPTGSQTLTSGSLVNGDTASSSSPTPSGATTSTSGYYDVGSYSLVANVSNLSDLGYNVSSGSATLTVNAKAISVSYTASDKAYDGSVTASVTASSGVLSGDAVTISQTATFADADVDSNKTVSISSIALNGNDAGNYTLNNQTASTTADITKAVLTITGTSIADKTYDGSTTATITAGSITGYVGTETLAITPVGAFGNANANTYSIDVSYTLGDGTNGGKASNYTLADTTGISADINQASLTITADDRSKTYGDSLTLGTSDFTPTGLVNSETIGSVTLTSSNGYGTTVTADANTYISEIVASAATGGTFNASNYSISYVAGDLTINQKAIDVSLTASNKVYNGSNAASVSATASTGILSGDTVNFAPSATFTDSNVGSAKTITLASLNTSGADAGNYSFTNTTTSLAADITQLASVAWTGGATGNWFDASNWAGGAVPSLSNVANVSIPTGKTVTFNPSGATVGVSTGNVSVDGISGAGNLTITGGDLTVGSSHLALTGLTQSAGTLTTTGNLTVDNYNYSAGTQTLGGDLTVSTDFAQASGAAISAAGNISITDSHIDINDDLTTSGAGKSVFLKTTGNITLAANGTITTNGGGITFWSDSDVDGGYIYINNGSTLDSRTNADRGAGKISDATTGGNIILGGGAGTTTPTGHSLQATSTGSPGGISLGSYGTNSAANIAIYSGGGDIALKGKTTDSTSSSVHSGIVMYEGTNINAGQSGDITFIGTGTGNSTVTGMDLQAWRAGYASSSIITKDGDISLTGTASGGSSYNIGISAQASASKPLTIAATGTGSVTLSGAATGTNDYGLYVLNNNILANSGAINLTGTSTDITHFTGTTIGSKSATDVTSSSSNVTLTHNAISLAANNGLQINTQGQVAIKPFADDFAANLNITDINLSSTISGLTIGKSATGADGTSDVNVTLNEAIGIAGDVSVYAADISINQNLSTANTSGQHVLLKASGDIVLAANKSVTTDGGNVTLWADSDATGSLAYIELDDGYSITTSGGDITLAGGLDDGSNGGTANDGIPDGYAAGKIESDTSSNIYAGIFSNDGTLDTRVSGSLDANAGNILMRGKGTQTNGSVTHGVQLWNTKIYTNDFEAKGTVTSTTASTKYYGVAANGATSPNNTVLRAYGDITLTGDMPTPASQWAVRWGTNHEMYTTAGSVNINAVGKLLYLSNQTLTFAAGEALVFDTDYTAEWRNAIAGDGGLIKKGSGTLELSGNNSFKGAVDLQGGTLEVTHSSGLGGGTSAVTVASGTTLDLQGVSTTKGLNLNGGTFKVTSGTNSVTGNVNLGANTTVNVSGTKLTLGGVISGAYNFAKSGNGTLALTNDNTYSGSTTISAGTLEVGAGSAGSLDTSAITNNGTLKYLVGQATTIDYPISGSGTVSITTTSGNITLADNISTTNTGTSAIVVNAGKNTAAGTSTGGNIIISGSPTLTTGTGGRVTLYTGSISGSTGLTSLVGSGSGNFRYNSDESSTSYTTSIGSGTYAIYREQPSVSYTAADASMTYGGSTPALTQTLTGSLQNGDTPNSATPVITGAATSTSGHYKAGTWTIAPQAGNLADLGYSLAATNGTLTVNKQALSVSYATTDRVYDATTAAQVSETLSGVITNDVVTVSETAAFTDKNIGTGKTVNVSGITLAGADAGNYTLATTATSSADITAKTISVSYTASNKTYDGNTLATVTSSGWISGDTVSASQTSLFSDKNVGTGKTVSMSNISLSGADAYNYTLASTTATTSADITKRTVTLAGASNISKTYDGLTSMPVGELGYGSLSNDIAGDDLQISGVPVFDSANAGNRTILQNNVALAGTDASNYNLTWTDGSGSISKAALTITANDDAKFVTQSDASNFAGVSYSGFVNSETAADLTGTLAVTRSNASVQLADDYTGVLEPSGFSSNNYTITYVDGDYSIVAASNLLVKVTNVTSTYGSNQTYVIDSAKYMDGSNSIIDLTSNITANGNSISMTDGAGGNASFTLTADGAVASTAGFVPAGNYSIAASGTTTNSNNFTALTISGSHTVNKKPISIAYSAANKVYDAGTSVTVTETLTGVETNDVVTITESAAFVDKNVTTGKAVNIGNIVMAGSDSANYQLSTSFTPVTADITAKALSFDYTASDKIYDANSSVTVDANLTGVISGDTVNINETASFSDQNAADNKTVSVSNIQLSGTDAGNYSLPATTDSTTASIAKKLLSLAYSGVNKVYDRLTSASVIDSLTGMINGDTVTVSETASFADKTVATNKTVSISNIALAGTEAGNYRLANTSMTTTADITAKPLTLSYVATDKTYDGNTTVTVTDSLGGVISGDTVQLSETAAFVSDQAGTGHNVNITSVAISGSDAANYSLPFSSTVVTADINKRTVSLSGNSNVNKVYDGTTTMPSSNIGYGSLSNVVSGDNLSVSGSPVYASANVGSHAINLGSVALAGSDAVNYNLNWTDGSGSISKAALTVTANDDAKFVTHSDVNNFAGVAFSGFVNGETVADLGGTLAISRSNNSVQSAGNYSGVLDASGYTSGNYQISYVAGDYTIVPANELLVRVTDVSSTYGSNQTYQVASAKYMDGANTIQDLSSNITASGNAISLTDGAGGSTSFTLAPVNASNSSSGYLEAGSYSIDAGSINNTSANFNNSLFVVGTHIVNQKPLSISYVGSDKIYDGNTSVTVTETLTGGVSGDTLTISESAIFASQNVATGISVNISAITLGGTDAANYALNTSHTPVTADINTRAVTITADDQEKNIGRTDPAFTYTTNTATSTTGLVSGETLTGTLTRVAGELVGDYAIQQGTLTNANNTNYSITYVAGKLEVKANNLVPNLPAAPTAPTSPTSGGGSFGTGGGTTTGGTSTGGTTTGGTTSVGSTSGGTTSGGSTSGGSTSGGSTSGGSTSGGSTSGGSTSGGSTSGGSTFGGSTSGGSTSGGSTSGGSTSGGSTSGGSASSGSASGGSTSGGSTSGGSTSGGSTSGGSTSGGSTSGGSTSGGSTSGGSTSGGSSSGGSSSGGSSSGGSTSGGSSSGGSSSGGSSSGGSSSGDSTSGGSTSGGSTSGDSSSGSSSSGSSTSGSSASGNSSSDGSTSGSSSAGGSSSGSSTSGGSASGDSTSGDSSSGGSTSGNSDSGGSADGSTSTSTASNGTDSSDSGSGSTDSNSSSSNNSDSGDTNSDSTSSTSGGSSSNGSGSKSSNSKDAKAEDQNTDNAETTDDTDNGSQASDTADGSTDNKQEQTAVEIKGHKILMLPKGGKRLINKKKVDQALTTDGDTASLDLGSLFSEDSTTASNTSNVEATQNSANTTSESGTGSLAQTEVLMFEDQQAAGTIQVTQTGSTMTAVIDRQASTQAAMPELTNVRYTQFDYQAANETTEVISVGISTENTLIIMVPDAIKATMDERHIVLLALAIAKRDLKVEIDTVASVIMNIGSDL
jgi:hypothetical protein